MTIPGEQPDLFTYAPLITGPCRSVGKGPANPAALLHPLAGLKGRITTTCGHTGFDSRW